MGNSKTIWFHSNFNENKCQNFPTIGNFKFWPAILATTYLTMSPPLMTLPSAKPHPVQQSNPNSTARRDSDCRCECWSYSLGPLLSWPSYDIAFPQNSSFKSSTVYGLTAAIICFRHLLLPCTLTWMQIISWFLSQTEIYCTVSPFAYLVFYFFPEQKFLQLHTRLHIS